MATTSAARHNLSTDLQNATQCVTESMPVLENARGGVGTTNDTGKVSEGVATWSKKGDGLGKVLQDDTLGVATSKTVPEATLKSVGNGIRVGTTNMPLKVAIVVATFEIMDLSCEIMANIQERGITGKIRQYMTGENDNKRVGTAARPLTVVSGVATSNENELQCPDLQAAPHCADADKSVHQEESVILDLGGWHCKLSTKSELRCGNN